MTEFHNYNSTISLGPEGDDVFNVSQIIGSGAFGTVCIATLKSEDNIEVSKRKMYAIKGHTPTSHPERISKELKYLIEVGGKMNIVGIHCAFRHKEYVYFAMPYLEHDDFGNLFDKMEPDEVQNYIKNLLIALCHVHKFDIVHRDVKPCNFLYNREKNEFLLVDFGLAERSKEPRKSKSPKCNKRKADMDLELNTKRQCLADPQKKTQCKCNRKLNTCHCLGEYKVCKVCLSRKRIKANTSGTPGYRSPEVLLKYSFQNSSVDIWSVGVIFLTLLSRLYPFFNAKNGLGELAEISVLFGTKAIKNTALALDRIFTVSRKREPLDLRKLCKLYRNKKEFASDEIYSQFRNSNENLKNCDNCEQYKFNCVCAGGVFHAESLLTNDICYFPDVAYDLLYKLLKVDPNDRITAEDALQHPFFRENLKK